MVSLSLMILGRQKLDIEIFLLSSSLLCRHISTFIHCFYQFLWKIEDFPIKMKLINRLKLETWNIVRQERLLYMMSEMRVGAWVWDKCEDFHLQMDRSKIKEFGGIEKAKIGKAANDLIKWLDSVTLKKKKKKWLDWVSWSRYVKWWGGSPK